MDAIDLQQVNNTQDYGSELLAVCGDLLSYILALMLLWSTFVKITNLLGAEVVNLALVHTFSELSHVDIGLAFLIDFEIENKDLFQVEFANLQEFLPKNQKASQLSPDDIAINGVSNNYYS